MWRDYIFNWKLWVAVIVILVVVNYAWQYVGSSSKLSPAS